jgi:hypothetical protein
MVLLLYRLMASARFLSYSLDFTSILKNVSSGSQLSPLKAAYFSTSSHENFQSSAGAWLLGVASTRARGCAGW